MIDIECSCPLEKKIINDHYFQYLHKETKMSKGKETHTKKKNAE